MRSAVVVALSVSCALAAVQPARAARPVLTRSARNKRLLTALRHQVPGRIEVPTMHPSATVQNFILVRGRGRIEHSLHYRTVGKDALWIDFMWDRPAVNRRVVLELLERHPGVREIEVKLGPGSRDEAVDALRGGGSKRSVRAAYRQTAAYQALKNAGFGRIDSRSQLDPTADLNLLVVRRSW